MQAAASDPETKQELAEDTERIQADAIIWNKDIS